MSDSLDIGLWLQGPNGSFLQTQWPLLASVHYGIINDKSSEVQFLRQGSQLDPQTVRIEFDDTTLEADSETGEGYRRKGMLFGTRGHPTIDDLDVETMDTFEMDNAFFTITFVNKQLIGQIQASFEAVA